MAQRHAAAHRAFISASPQVPAVPVLPHPLLRSHVVGTAVICPLAPAQHGGDAGLAGGQLHRAALRCRARHASAGAVVVEDDLFLLNRTGESSVQLCVAGL